MNEKFITVTKTVSEKFPADTVNISVTAAQFAKKYADAVGEADRAADRTVAALKNAGFTDIRSLGINVSAVRDDGKTTGYRAMRTFALNFPFDKTRLGAAIDALSDGACEWRISFSLGDKSAAETLLARAVERARAEAGVIAKAAGVKLGAMVKADYSSSDGDIARPMMLRANFAMADGAANAAEPELITLSETVTVSFEIV